MKIIVDKDKLIATVAPMSGCVSNKNTIASIGGILIQTDKTDCILSAYDLEKGMRTHLEAEIVEEGAYILNAGKLVQIVRSMSENRITIEVDPKTNKTTISSGTAAFDISALNGEDFPDLPELAGDDGFRIRQCDLRDMIGKTLFAVGQNDPRPSLNGSYFKIQGNKMTIVGCNGNCLSLSETECDLEITQGAGNLDMEFIIPGKSLTELLHLISDTEETCEMQLTRKHVILTVGGFILFSRLIDQQYVEYERFIPKSSRLFVTVSTARLTAALERALLVTEDKQQGQLKSPVILDFNEGILTVSSTSVVSRVSDTIETEQDGGNMEIGFSCRLLLDALRCVDTENVKLSLSSSLMGMLMEPVGGNEKKRLLLLVLPVRLLK